MASSINTYEIWSEGYAATGNSGTAIEYGTFEAATFKEACDLAFREPEHDLYYDSKRLTYWGCKLFNNEADARKTFG